MNVVVGILVGIFAIILLASSLKIVQQYEMGVVFRLGRVVGTKGPGLRVIVPFIDRLHKVDMRIVTLDIPSQEVITRDNVTVRVNAVVYFRVVDAVAALVQVLDYRYATFQIGQTTLRNVLGQHELDELLTQREKLNEAIRRIIDEATEPWGIKVSMVEIKDVELPETMQRAMAAQAESERERRAKIIHADGEYQAAAKLAEAARMLASEPVALQLRYLQTLAQIATERTTTLVFPLPLELLSALAPDRRRSNEG